MALDAQSKALWEMQNQGRLQKVGIAPIHLQREEFRMIAIALERPRTPVPRCEDRFLPGGPPEGVPVRLYWPPRTPGDVERLAAIVYVHGGGYVVGDLNTHDSMMREICARAGVLVCSVDYRLAPEHKFPAGLEDVCTAVRWVSAHAQDLGIDPERIGIGGESAGGNMAAAAALVALEDPEMRIAAQFLFYPNTCTLEDYTSPSRRELGDEGGFIPTRRQIEGVIRDYTRSPEDRRNPLVSPLLKKDLRGAAPALICTAGYDTLRDEGKEYADRLAAAGVPVEYRCLETTIHGFLNFGKVLDVSDEAFDYFAREAKEMLRPK